MDTNGIKKAVQKRTAFLLHHYLTHLTYSARPNQKFLISQTGYAL